MLTEVICAGTEHLVANSEDCDASAILIYPKSELTSALHDGKFAREDRNFKKQTFSDDATYRNDDDDLIRDCYEHYDSCCIDDEFDYDVDDY